MNNITRFTAAVLLAMSSVAAFAQSTSEVQARDRANMNAGDNYPVVIFHGTATRAEVKADLIKAEHDGLITNGDNYPVLPNQRSGKALSASNAEIINTSQNLDTSLYSGA